jgi:hypothetical protein
MGVAALVLGIIAIILAFFGGVGGVVLGIAAVVLGVLGRRAAERDGLPQGAATAGLVTGIVGIVLGAAIFAACVKCATGCAEVARGVARLGEAQVTMEEIARLEISYYEAERLDVKGSHLPKTFASAGAVPAKVPCQGKPVMVTPEEWKAAGWDKIRFGPAGPTMFQFEAITQGEGKTARLDIIARVDPRCDGSAADFRQRVAVDDQGRPYLIQNRFGQQSGRMGYRRGVQRSAAPGAVPTPGGQGAPEGDEQPDDADDSAAKQPIRPALPAASGAPAPPAVPAAPALPAAPAPPAAPAVPAHPVAPAAPAPSK